MNRGRRSLRRHQRGFLLIALIVILAMGGLYLFVSQFDSVRSRQERDLKTSLALATAKDALIAWSVSRDTTAGQTPGQLPCPEDTSLIGSPTEGQAQSSCDTGWRIGRLPWKTLKLGDLRDGYGEPLWYALSAGFRDVPINSGTAAQLTLDGVAAGAVAIVFSPGPPLAGQSRPAISDVSPPAVANYLDLTNGDGDAAFAGTGSPDTFNDKLLPITHQNLFLAVGRRVAAEIRGDGGNGLQRFFTEHANALPMAADAPLGIQGASPNGFVPYGDASLMYPGSAWLNANGWFSLAGYQRTQADRATITVDTRNHAFTFQ